MQDRNKLTIILNDPRSSPEEKAQAQRELDTQGTGEPHPVIVEFSEAAIALFRTFGKSHLADVSADQWAEYSRHHSLTGREAVCAEYWQWHCLDDEYLELLGESRRWWWERVRDHATSEEVRAHAQSQIKLEGEGDER